jgi:CBS domain containing-hemolysin-like protein
VSSNSQSVVLTGQSLGEVLRALNKASVAISCPSVGINVSCCLNGQSIEWSLHWQSKTLLRSIDFSVTWTSSMSLVIGAILVSFFFTIYPPNNSVPDADALLQLSESHQAFSGKSIRKETG